MTTSMRNPQDVPQVMIEKADPYMEEEAQDYPIREQRRDVRSLPRELL